MTVSCECSLCILISTIIISLYFVLPIQVRKELSSFSSWQSCFGGYLACSQGQYTTEIHKGRCGVRHLWCKAPVNKNRPHVFSETMKIYPRIMILKVGWERTKASGELKALLKSVEDENWQGLSCQPYAKPVHLVLEDPVYSSWCICLRTGHCNNNKRKINAIVWPLNLEGKILDEDGSQGMAGSATGHINIWNICM